MAQTEGGTNYPDYSGEDRPGITPGSLFIEHISNASEHQQVRTDGEMSTANCQAMSNPGGTGRHIFSSKAIQ